MAYLIKPFFSYGATGLKPGVDEEDPRTPRGVERFKHVAANGRVITYKVGRRKFIEVTFRWQDQTLKTEWETFFDAVDSGQRFVYYDDDTVKFAAASGVDASAFPPGAGQPTDGTAVAQTWVTMESEDLDFIQEEIDGYWSVTIRMREE